MKDPKDHDPPQTKKTNTLDLHRESLQSLSSSQLRGVTGGHAHPGMPTSQGHPPR
jgi:hypothetical protein